MHHFMIDGFQGFRSRFDHVQLIQEVLEEVPTKLGLRPVMPAFLLPYYNGVTPDDCGVSAFLFLQGGHFSIHTFSFREAYFADLLSPAAFDAGDLKAALEAAFPCGITTSNVLARAPGAPSSVQPDTGADFGPHLFLDVAEFAGPRTMDELFDLFDRLPGHVGMTPIMRPYLVKGASADGGRFLSALTMIAESHISLHLFPDEDRAYFDLFSCSFFDPGVVIPSVRALLPGRVTNEALIARGTGYRLLRTERHDEQLRARSWLAGLGARRAIVERLGGA